MQPSEWRIEIARKWVGTPFRKFGRVRGLACDCIGLPIMVSRECGYPVLDVLAYSLPPMEKVLLDYLGTWWDRVGCTKILPGDMAVLPYNGVRTHCVIVGDGVNGSPLSIIHACNKMQQVREQPARPYLFDKAFVFKFREV